MQRQCCPESVRKFIPGVGDVPSLRAITNHADFYYTFVATPDDADWWYSETSLLPDDGLTVAQPDDVAPGQPGRWIKYGAGANSFVGLIDTPGAIDPGRGLLGRSDGAELIFADLPEVVEVPFAFNTASPLIITTVLAGQKVLSLEVEIIVAFDDPASFLKLGTLADLEKLLVQGYSYPAKKAVYANKADCKFTIDEMVFLTIAPAASTIGNGTVQLKINRS